MARGKRTAAEGMARELALTALPLRAVAAGRGVRLARILPSLRAYWPAFVTAPALCATLLVFAARHHVQRVSDFIIIGVRYAAPYHLTNLADSLYGYDGQFTYYIARFPGYLPAPFDWSALRYSRMLHPLLLRLLSFGDVDLMPYVLLGMGIAAVSGTVALMTWLLRQRGLPLWLALVPGLYCGQALALERDLADPIAIFFIALALVGLERRRWLLTAAALGLGMLTRESTLVFALCFAAPLVFERRWRTLAGYLATVFLPYLYWQVMVYLWLGLWGFLQSSQTNTLVHIPFQGLAAHRSRQDLIEMVLFACIPAVAAVALGALALLEQPWRSPSGAPGEQGAGGRSPDAVRFAAALAAVAYGVAVSLQPGIHWLDIWEPMRLAAPLMLLLPLLAPRALPRSVARRLPGLLPLARLGWTALLLLLLIASLWLPLIA